MQLVSKLDVQCTIAKEHCFLKNKAYVAKQNELSRVVAKLEAMDPSDMNYGLTKLRMEVCQQEVKNAKGVLDIAKRNRTLTTLGLKTAKTLGPMLEEACPLMDYADKVTQGVALVYRFMRLYQSIPTTCEDDAKRAEACRGLAISGGAYVSGLYAVKLGT